MERCGHRVCLVKPRWTYGPEVRLFPESRVMNDMATSEVSLGSFFFCGLVDTICGAPCEGVQSTCFITESGCRCADPNVEHTVEGARTCGSSTNSPRASAVVLWSRQCVKVEQNRRFDGGDSGCHARVQRDCRIKWQAHTVFVEFS